MLVFFKANILRVYIIILFVSFLKQFLGMKERLHSDRNQIPKSKHSVARYTVVLIKNEILINKQAKTLVLLYNYIYFSITG